MSNWPLVPLRRVANIVNGGTPTSDGRNWDGRVPWATPVDLAAVDGGHLSATLRLLTEEGLRTGSRTVPTGSLIISTRAPIGYVAQVNQVTAFNQGCRGLVPQDSCDGRFLQYALISQTDVLQSLGTGSTFLELSTEALANVMVPLPPLEEQRRIANYLDDQTTRIDQAIQLRQQQLVVVQQQLVGVAHAQITGIDFAGRRTRVDLPWADTLPSDWGTPRICQVARMGTGHTPSRSEPEYWVDCDIPWLTTSDVHGFRRDEIDSLGETAIQISRLGLENSAAVIHPAGTVALSRTASAGFSVVMDRDMATSQDFATWTCGERLLPHYLLWCLRVMRADLLGRLATGSTHKTIYFPDLMSIRIPLPPIEYQEKAVEEIQRAAEAIRGAVGLLEESIDLMRERRRSLISAVVAGGVG